MQTFYGEYGLFHNCLSFMGYDPSGEVENRYYAIGIDQDATIDAGAFQSAVNSGLNGTLCAANNPSAAGVTWFPAGKGVGDSVVTTLDGISSLGSQADAFKQTFVLQADAVISADFITAANRSKVTLNQDKKFNIVSPGF